MSKMSRVFLENPELSPSKMEKFFKCFTNYISSNKPESTRDEMFSRDLSKDPFLFPILDISFITLLLMCTGRWSYILVILAGSPEKFLKIYSETLI